MNWYTNSVFIGSVVLGIIACSAMWLLPPLEAKDITVPIVAGIAGIVTGTTRKVTDKTSDEAGVVTTTKESTG